MSKKLFFGAVILAILATSTFAADLLASLTNGKISDNSPGAKVVTIHNGMMQQVRSVSRTNKIVNEVYRAKGNELNRILFSKY